MEAEGVGEKAPEVKCEVAASGLDPSAPEFRPVWPLPSAPHRRSAALKPLLFPEPHDREDRTHLLRRSRDLPLPCVLCELCFGDDVTGGDGEGEWERARDTLLRHLLEQHAIVIHQVSHIASLRSYCQHWHQRFKEEDISVFCPVIRTNTDTSDIGPSCDYHLMSDALPEDRQLRRSLQLARLEAILEQQQVERTDTEFKRSCLFCGLVVTGNRASLFQHMLTDHGFNVGHSDNLVFVNEFLDLLQEKLDKLLCLYCEKVFTDRSTLKEHMRKKQHKMINPNNTEYDRFYVINYLEPGRHWQEIMAEEEEHTTRTQERWDDWYEDRLPALHCLFCSTFTSSDLHTLTHHMKEAHMFDWHSVVGCHDYYQQVKAVNYLRRQVATQRCPACLSQCDSDADLTLHMEVKGHCTLPSDVTTWDQPQYLFPTFENDVLLCFLDDNNDATE